MRDLFVYGAQYYRPPNPPRSERRRDIEQIRALGFNTIKIWAMWNWVNSKPDSYDTEELDELLDLAEHTGLKVVINTILENAPYWLFEKYPEARYLSADGHAVDSGPMDNTPSGGWPGLCLDHEKVADEAARFLRALAQKFRQHPALLCWDVWNEPHLEPLSRPFASPERSLYCYCSSSLNRYTEWLRGQYPAIEDLNSAWGARYGEWEDVKPPRAWGGYPQMVEWMRFWQENIARWMRFRVQALKAADPDHPIISHEGPDGVVSDHVLRYTFDDWKTAEPLDHWGCSSFPRWSRTDHCLTALHLDIALSAARGKECWVSELQGGGQHDSASIFPHDPPSPLEIAAWNLLAVASGMKGILYWQYRPELLGPESLGFGLVAPDGTPTERTRMSSRLAWLLTSLPLLSHARPAQPRVAIIHSKASQTLLYAARREDQPLRRSIEGIYRALWEANIPVAFVRPDDSLERLSVYDALYYPFPLAVSADEAANLSEYVERGGTVIAECHVGQYDTLGRASEVVPGQGLDELFGARRREGFRLECQAVRLGEAELFAHEYREMLELRGGIGRGKWPDGSPLMVENGRGKGRAILLSTLAFGDSRNAAILLKFLPESVRPVLEVNPRIFARPLESPEGHAVILVNTRTEPVEAVLDCPGANLGETVRDIWNERPIKCVTGRLVLTLDLNGCAVLVAGKTC